MSEIVDLEKLRSYFKEKLSTFGVTPQGVDWNSSIAQELRFAQLSRIILSPENYSLLDYGSGFGRLYSYLKAQGHSLRYMGFDFVLEMVERGKVLFANDPACRFTTQETDLTEVDYSVASGIFNIRLQSHEPDWIEYVLRILHKLNQLSRKGFAFNMLTRYSDPEYMKPNLYYADPCFYFDYCKRNFARNIALLHDYGLYDFTILVRKELD